jgi:hypothetical protein
MIKSFREYITEVKDDNVTFSFGRFNPPTTGHEKLCNAVAKTARGGKYFIYASQSSDAKKNPLEYTTKIKWMRKMYPKHARAIILDKKIRNVFDICVSLYNKGYRNITMVVGSDRIQEFEALIAKYNGKDARHGFYDFSNISVVSAGDRDPDAEGVTGMSASKMRAAAQANNFDQFQLGIPKGFKDAQKLFNDVRKGMELSESKKFRRNIKFKPLSDQRETYIQGRLHTVGDVVEIDEGIGEIEVLGSNYVIVKTESGNKYRKWVSDIKTIAETKENINSTSRPIKTLTQLKTSFKG